MYFFYNCIYRNPNRFLLTIYSSSFELSSWMQRPILVLFDSIDYSMLKFNIFFWWLNSTVLLPTSLNCSPNSLYPSMYRQPFAIIRLLASQGLGIRNHLRRSAKKRSTDQLKEMWRLYRSRCETKLINVSRKWKKNKKKTRLDKQVLI